jgi:hypothetical protein
MIKLDRPSNNGNPIVIKYDVATEIAEFSSFADILDRNGVPPSKFAPTDPAAIGGVFDHVFGFVRYPFTDTNRWISTEGIKPSGGEWWANFASIIVSDVGSTFGGDFVWIVITDMEYVEIEPVTTVKVTMHFGLDVYIA